MLRELIAVTETGSEAARCAAYRATDALLALKKAADTARDTGPTDLSSYDRGTRRTANRGHRRHRGHCRPVLEDRGQASRPVPAAGPPLGRLPALGPRPGPALRQQRGRADHPHGETPHQNLRKPAHLRTLQGARDFAAIRTYFATADRHGQQMLDVLTHAMRGRPWTPTTS